MRELPLMAQIAVQPAATVAVSWSEWVKSRAWEDGADTIPMLPSLAHEIADIALNPDIPAIRVSGIVSKDPVLATAVIQLANSAYSASAIEITSISEAVVRLGTSAVRSIVTASCLTAMMADPKVYGSRGREMIDHSIGTAYLARLIADGCGGDADDAFLAGLLHDIGKLLILKLASEVRLTVERPSPEEVEALLASEHAALGGYLVKRWHLPSTLEDPIVWHHDPERAAERSQTALIVYAANRLAHRYGFGCTKEEVTLEAEPLFSRVRITEKALARFDERAPGLFEIARKIVR
jgi:putative nucleotidyltransferase with HDIG domain